MQQMKCTNCGADLAEGVLFCRECGAKVETALQKKRFCRECGAEIPAGAKFCIECGARLIPEAPVYEETPDFGQPHDQAPAPESFDALNIDPPFSGDQEGQ